MNKIQLETEKIVLRPFHLSDAEHVQILANDQQIHDTTVRIPYPYKIEMAEQWIQSHNELFEKQIALNFAITIKPELIFIGAIGLELDMNNKKAELGYWVGVEYWNKGYCTEAAIEVIKYGFQKIGLIRIESICMTKNTASEKVLIKIGMKKEGILRKYMLKNGISEDVYVYSLLNDDLLI